MVALPQIGWYCGRLRGSSAIIHAIVSRRGFEPAPEIGPTSVIIDGEHPVRPRARGFVPIEIEV
jgi:hypothetical protein